MYHALVISLLVLFAEYYYKMISLFSYTSYHIPPTNPAFHLLVVSIGLPRGDPRRTDVCIKHKLKFSISLNTAKKGKFQTYYRIKQLMDLLLFLVK